MSEERPGRSVALRTLLELLVILLISFALVFGFVRPVVAAPFYVGSESMVPTLEVWDRVLINKLAYDLDEPERGDIVLFRSPSGGEDPLIKRVVGLPGDTIEVRRDRLLVNGEPRREPYVNEETRKLQTPYGPLEVPEGHVFVMGDNRGYSRDSRFFGPVPEENLIGEALFRFWPPARRRPTLKRHQATGFRHQDYRGADRFAPAGEVAVSVARPIRKTP